MCEGNDPSRCPSCYARQHEDHHPLCEEVRLQRERETWVDWWGETCLVCGEGSYQETSIQDDWAGVLHCVACGHMVKRWAPPREHNLQPTT